MTRQPVITTAAATVDRVRTLARIGFSLSTIMIFRPARHGAFPTRLHLRAASYAQPWLSSWPPGAVKPLNGGRPRRHQ